MMKKLTSLLLSVVLLVSLLGVRRIGQDQLHRPGGGPEGAHHHGFGEPAGHGGKRHRFPEV